MSKYPCGICTIGVKHKGILCTGACNLWFHSKCLNWSDKQLKTLKNSDIEKWKCGTCAKISENQKNSVVEIEQKIKNLGDTGNTDLETSLTLASEIGSALLAENQELKQNVFDLASKNTKLTAELEELRNDRSNSIIYQQQMEELEN